MGITNKGGMRNPFDHKPVHLLAENLRKTIPKKEVLKDVSIIQGLTNKQAKKETKEIRKR